MTGTPGTAGSEHAKMKVQHFYGMELSQARQWLLALIIVCAFY